MDYMCHLMFIDKMIEINAEEDEEYKKIVEEDFMAAKKTYKMWLLLEFLVIFVILGYWT